MDELIASADKEVLIEMVKLAQKRGMAGNRGGWKAFLKVYDTKFGASMSDPSRRPVESLKAFLNTFEQPDDVKFFEKVLECHSNRDVVEQLKKTDPDNENPEQMLVRLTLAHPMYPIEYSFPSYDEEWLIISRSKKSKSIKCKEIIAIDCEMVLCEDGTEALVKVCAVDRNLKVRLDEVVNPNKAIADYRTEITGISAEDLDGVTHSLKDVQISMKKLLAHGAILVGHSLNNDLQALKLDHKRVIDTSYVFKYDGPTIRKPSLSMLCKTVLGYELRKKGNPHNCLDDACAAMKLVLARIQGETSDIVVEEVKELDMAKLLVHRIPVNISSNDLNNILPGDFTIEVKLSKLKRKPARDTYTAFATFKNQQEATDAFENLEGDLEKDTIGRPQKLVKFELDSGTSGFIYVCKIFDEEAKKRSAEDDISGVLKKLKTNQTSGELENSIGCSDQCELHSKEIERLKNELSEKDQRISNLNKIIVSLTRKQGL